MAIEIERKFLLSGEDWKHLVTKKSYFLQGYIPTKDKTVVRCRIADETAFITLKTKRSGISRAEYEYPIPLEDAKEIIESMCEKPIIEKHRHYIPQGNHTWEVDIFHGENEGLILAEIELKTEEDSFEIPSWIGREVSDNSNYNNSYLAQNPFSKWTESEKNL